MKKNIFLYVLFLVVSMSLLTSSCIMTTASTGDYLIYDVWDGSTEMEPMENESGSIYNIYNARQLYTLQQRGTYPAGDTYRLKANIDLAGKNWTPIGTSSSYFQGTFEGEGHTIKGLKLPNLNNTGLFCWIQGVSSLNTAKVENLNIILSDGNITSSTVHRVGVLAGYAQYAEITNVTISAASGAKLNIISTASMDLYVGGIIGDSLSDTTISESSSNVNITAKSFSFNCSSGGISGKITSANITKCYNRGKIFAESSATITHAGGITGTMENSASISSSYSTGEITATGYGSAYSGGIAGLAKSISYCYATGDVSAITSSSAFAGGIAGYLNSSTINNCYARCNITTNTSSITDFAFAGGILGNRSSGVVMNCIFLRGIINASGTICYAGNIAGTFNGADINNTASSSGIHRDPMSSDTDANNGTLDNYADLLQTVTTTTFNWGSEWRFRTGHDPKLQWE